VLCDELVLCLICVSVYSVLGRINGDCFNRALSVLCCLWSSYGRAVSPCLGICAFGARTCARCLHWGTADDTGEATGRSRVVSRVEKVAQPQGGKGLLLCTSCWFRNTVGNVHLGASARRRHRGERKMQEEDPESSQSQLFPAFLLPSFRKWMKWWYFFLYWFTLNSGLSSRQDEK